MSKLTAATAEGLTQLEAHLGNHAYVSGTALPSEDDSRVLSEIKGNLC
jgi:hypothetical protein